MDCLGSGVCYQECYLGENVIEKEFDAIKLGAHVKRLDEEHQNQLCYEDL